MSVFREAEIEYLQSHRIGRVATIGRNGDPHVVPLRYRYNPEMDVIELFGGGMGTSKKYRDAAATGRIAFVVDDISEAGKPRGVEIRGRAEVLAEGGDEIMPHSDPQYIRITPKYIASWGVDSDPHRPAGRKAR